MHKMKALIFNNKVVQVAQQIFDVHADFIWVDCPINCVAGWSYDGSEFHEPELSNQIHDEDIPTIDDKIDALFEFAISGDNYKVIDIANKLK